MTVVVWTLLAFLSGSIPYSLLIGRLAAHVDIRTVGDHNPGATNVLKAANWRWFVVAMLLDYFKAAIPVGWAWFFSDLTGWQIVPVAIAPVLGHAFSPFLRFKGGKAVAATFGTWTGLTLWAGPTVFGVLLGMMHAIFTVGGWAVLAALLVFGVFIWVVYPQWIVVWGLNLMLLVYKHRQDFGQLPIMRGWVVRLVRAREK